MNSHSRKNNLAKLILSLSLNFQRNNGYTLPEILVLIFILSILTALIVPQLNFNDPTADALTQLKGILQQTRGRAISTTSAIRIKPDPSQPDNKFILERAITRGCQSSTRLSADVASSDLDIPVYSTAGFQVGDRISVGSDSTNNEILGIPGGSPVLTLGSPLGTTQTADSPVELVNNWQPDASISAQELTLPDEASVSANLTDWTLCINSRGIAFIYDSNLNQQNSLVLTISSTANSNTETVTVLKGGAIQ